MSRRLMESPRSRRVLDCTTERLGCPDQDPVGGSHDASRIVMPCTFVLVLLALGHEPEPQLSAWGCDPSRGVLVNYTPDAALTGGAIAPGRPTLVVVHGLNPLHPLVHFTVAERYAEAIAARHGSSVNVLGWDWNADTMRGIGARALQAHAVAHGRALGAALLAQGIDPSRVHLIGESAGAIVATSAARVLRDATGQPLACLTLLDPVTHEHSLLFEQLCATSTASRVENFWAPGISGFGGPAPYEGVANVEVPGPLGWRGLVHPFRSDHLNTTRWHIGQLGP